MNTPANLKIEYVTDISHFNIEFDMQDENLTLIYLRSSIAQANGYSEASIDIADLDNIMTALENCRTLLKNDTSPAITINLEGYCKVSHSYRIHACVEDQSIMITTLSGELSFSKCKRSSFIVRTDDDISNLLSHLKLAQQYIANVSKKLLEASTKNTILKI